MLFEDLVRSQLAGIIPVDASDDPYWKNLPTLSGVKYFNPTNVTNAYHNAAL